SRARLFGSRAARRSGSPTCARSRRSTWASSRLFVRSRCGRRAPPCTAICRTAASATKSSRRSMTSTPAEEPPPQGRNAMQPVLITGASGGIGTRLRSLFKGVYPRLRLSDLKVPSDLATDEEFIAADLADMAAVERIVAGVDGIVHLGGFSVEGPWETILSANLDGGFNLFQAAPGHPHRPDRLSPSP